MMDVREPRSAARTAQAISAARRHRDAAAKRVDRAEALALLAPNDALFQAGADVGSLIARRPLITIGAVFALVVLLVGVIWAI